MQELVGQQIRVIQLIDQGMGHTEWCSTGTLLKAEEHMICVNVESIAHDQVEIGTKDNKVIETWFNTRADTFSRISCM